MKTIPRYFQEIPAISFISAFFIRTVKFPSNYIFLDSARSSIKWILSQISRSYERKLIIGIPCYSCASILHAIVDSDNEPQLIDINPLDFTISNEIIDSISNLDVLIWINFFGLKYPVILKLIRARLPNLIIIEDCSHVDLRDYQNQNKEELYSDYLIFSFNFRKPITAGGGGLLIFNETRNGPLNIRIRALYNTLTSSKLTIYMIINILINNYSYNRFIFGLFNKLIAYKRNNTRILKSSSIKIFSMNGYLKKLFFSQFLNSSIKTNLVLSTLNYFNNIKANVNYFSFGTLYYFPVPIKSISNNSKYKKIDTFILWNNLKLNYKLYNIDVSEHIYPRTFKFFNESLFYPAEFFNECNNMIIDWFTSVSKF